MPSPLYGFRAIAEASGIDRRILALLVRDRQVGIIFRVLLARQRRLREKDPKLVSVIDPADGLRDLVIEPFTSTQ